MISIKWWSVGILGDDITLSREQRRTVGRKALKDFLRHPWRVAAFIGLQLVPQFVLVLVIWSAASLLTRPTGPIKHFTLIMVLVLLIWYAAQMVTVVWALRNIYGPHLRKAMREVGWEVCLNCGYVLRGLDDDVEQCSECGAKREAMAASPGSRT